MHLLRNVILAIGLGGLAVGAFACGGGSKSEETTPAATQEPAASGDQAGDKAGDQAGEPAPAEGDQAAPPADDTGEQPQGEPKPEDKPK